MRDIGKLCFDEGTSDFGLIIYIFEAKYSQYLIRFKMNEKKVQCN